MAAAPATAPAVSRLALATSGRPMPRALANSGIARNNESIAAAIAEVNAELAAAQATRSSSVLGGLIGRPMPRPGTAVGSEQAAVTPVARAGSASTFAVAPPRPPMADAEADPVLVADTSAGRTSDEAWGVQLGAFRARGDAERHLLTTALRDVPPLSGGLRRVEPARIQGTTVFRAQFVGLTQEEAQGACATLAQMQTDCLPLAPGI